MSDAFGCRCIISEDNPIAIATFHGDPYGGRTFQEDDDNAQFIVHAVNCHHDLLNACKAALYKPTAWVNDPDGAIRVDVNTEIRDLLLAAIQKAEGKT